MNKCNFIITVAILSMLASGFTYATTLTPTLIGDFNVPPFPGPYVDPFPPVVTGTNTFTQSWTGTLANTNWWDGTGPYTATGPRTSSGFSGTTTFNFTSLALGYLPRGTAFVFSDVDSGSFEQIDLSASNTSGLITTSWLDAPTVDWMGSAVNADTAACAGNTSCLPSYTLVGGTYSFSGAGVSASNPTLLFILLSNTDITQLEVTKAHVNNGFGLRAPPPGAPIPEPTTLALLALGFAGLGFSRSQIGLVKSKALPNITA